MICIQKRFLSRCANFLSSEMAQTYFRLITARLKTRKKSKTDHLETADCHSCLLQQETATTLASFFYDKLEMLKQLNILIKEESDSEIQKIAKMDSDELTAELDDMANKIADALIPITEYDMLNKCQLEITPGVGGVEASLFASELTQMYHNYTQFKKWKWIPCRIDPAPSGGIRSAVVFVRGKGAFRMLRYEVGVHRVQRFPLTDKTRMHTSTSVVAVLPEPEKIETCLRSNDIKVETMRASGPGGQNVNQRSTAVRLTHRETGISVHCSDERTQYSNMDIAHKRLAAILLQRKLDESQKQYSSSRKLQVGTKARAEKVRTYNFKDDHVIDHRLSRTWQGVMNVMKGNTALDEIIDELNELSKIQHLQEIMCVDG
ncbi:unnamed protein product [Thelazia callipaeda]|uniref:RF_PROK_I domain-containing protein n=1 Tax=Thelazia callipaeda TaxID=103827 RepID=A0A0N5D9B9_THECL|nr:unnamed protein product [Thelazia callipaeda]